MPHEYAEVVRKSVQACRFHARAMGRDRGHVAWRHGSAEIATVHRRSRQHPNPRAEWGW